MIDEDEEVTPNNDNIVDILDTLQEASIGIDDIVECDLDFSKKEDRNNDNIVGRSIDDILDILQEASIGMDDIVECDLDFSKKEDPNIVLSPNATPFEVIKFFAHSSGIDIKDSPAKNCTKCHGRGFIGFDSKSKMAIPCRCIFHKEDLHSRLNQTVEGVMAQSVWNRKQRRQAKKK